MGNTIRIANKYDAKAISNLMAANHLTKGGLLSVQFTAYMIEGMINDMPILIAEDNSQLIRFYDDH